MYVALLVWLCARINVGADHVLEEPLEKPVNQEADAVDDAYVSEDVEPPEQYQEQPSSEQFEQQPGEYEEVPGNVEDYVSGFDDF
ncbi:hypothetical protein PAHAL_5G333800 [Panicum hallii]|uniref:Secreted protein n=1 Tax=Panicum hallii TaxID=206008 RepID=A0A2T8IM21_9POAL|nr:hypothetical protein PAHAL_5G333800 [Panicum hallii]